MGLWYYAANGTSQGPVDQSLLLAKLRGGELTPDTLVWTEGMSGWAALRTRSEFAQTGPPILPAAGPHPLAGNTSVASVWGEAWGIFSKNWGMLSLAVLIAFMIQGAVGVIPLLGPVVGIFVGPWMMRGLVAVMLAAVDGRNPSLDGLFSQQNYFFQAGFAHLCLGVTVMGFVLLLVIPGVVVGMLFCLWTFLMVDRGERPFAALDASYYLMKGHLLDLFLLGLVVFAVVVAGILCLGVGVFPASALAFLLYTVFYRRLSASPAGVLS